MKMCSTISSTRELANFPEDDDTNAKLVGLNTIG